QHREPRQHIAVHCTRGSGATATLLRSDDMGANTESAALADDAPHLLVVDDDRRIRDLLSRFLLGEGYRVTTASTAAEARGRLDGLRFDLLILDVMMPGETGIELTRALRTSSSVPILMLTARGEADSRIA